MRDHRAARLPVRRPDGDQPGPGPGASGISGAWGGLPGPVFGAAAWLVPVAIGAAASCSLSRRAPDRPPALGDALGIALILAAVVGLIHLPLDDKFDAAQRGLGGGWAGYYVSNLFQSLAGGLGAAPLSCWPWSSSA